MLTNRFCKEGKVVSITQNGRICTVCKIEKSLSEYHNAPKVKIDGKDSQCKQCKAKKGKEYLKSLPAGVHRSRRKKYSGEYALNMNYKRFFGLNLEIVRKMWEEQDRKCASCSKEINLGGKDRAMKSNLDHNHTTGKVRGLICNMCNLQVGVLENTKKMKNLIQYLKKYDVIPEYIKEC